MSVGKFEQFVTLPASASARDFPNNTRARYSVKLRNRLRLMDKRYQVALVEVVYSNTWYNVTDGRMKVFDKKTAKATPIDIYPGRPRSMTELLARIHRALLTMKLEKAFSFYHSDYDNRVTLLCHEEHLSIQLPSDLANILKLKTNVWYTRGKYKGFGGADIDVSCRMLYIYTDLVEDRPVGDVTAPLLRVVPVKGSRNEDIAIEFAQPQYVEARKVDTDVVSVVVATEQGKDVPFRSGRVALTLHIKEV